MEIGDTVRVKADGSIGVVRIIEGAPARKAYVDIEPGANAGYVYIRMHVPMEHQYIEGTPDGPDTLALNPYDIDDLEIVI